MVHLTIGGKERVLAFDVNALCRLKQEQGINLLQPGEQDVDDPVVLRAVIWAGFLMEEPTLTVETVGSWITLGNLASVSAAFFRAIHEAVTPQSEAGQDATTRPLTAEESAGMTSSASVMASVG